MSWFVWAEINKTICNARADSMDPDKANKSYSLLKLLKYIYIGFLVGFFYNNDDILFKKKSVKEAKATLDVNADEASMMQFHSCTFTERSRRRCRK